MSKSPETILSDIKTPILQGYLMQKGEGVLHGWNKRYFVLTPAALLTYKTLQESHDVHNSVTNVSHMNILFLDWHFDKKHLCEFELELADGTKISLKAATPEEARNWITCVSLEKAKLEHAVSEKEVAQIAASLQNPSNPISKRLGLELNEIFSRLRRFTPVLPPSTPTPPSNSSNSKNIKTEDIEKIKEKAKEFKELILEESVLKRCTVLKDQIKSLDNNDDILNSFLGQIIPILRKGFSDSKLGRVGVGDSTNLLQVINDEKDHLLTPEQDHHFIAPSSPENTPKKGHGHHRRTSLPAAEFLKNIVPSIVPNIIPKKNPPITKVIDQSRPHLTRKWSTDDIDVEQAKHMQEGSPRDMKKYSEISDVLTDLLSSEQILSVLFSILYTEDRLPVIPFIIAAWQLRNGRHSCGIGRKHSKVKMSLQASCNACRQTGLQLASYIGDHVNQSMINEDLLNLLCNLLLVSIETLDNKSAVKNLSGSPQMFCADVKTPMMWRIIFGALYECPMTLRAEFSKQLNTVLIDNEENCDSLMLQSGWQYFILPLFIDMPINRLQKEEQLTFSYLTNIFVLLHFHSFAQHSNFSERLARTLIAINQYGGLNQRSLDFCRVVLLALATRIQNDKAMIALASDTLEWKNIRKLGSLLKTFIFTTPRWGSFSLPPKELVHVLNYHPYNQPLNFGTFGTRRISSQGFGVHTIKERNGLYNFTPDVKLLQQFILCLKSIGIEELPLDTIQGENEKKLVQEMIIELEFFKDATLFINMLQSKFVNVEEKIVRDVESLTLQFVSSENHTERSSVFSKLQELSETIGVSVPIINLDLKTSHSTSSIPT